MQLEDTLVGASGSDLDVLVVDEALAALAAIDARKAKVVELRFFGGLAITEVAEVLSGPMLMIFVIDAVEALINLGAGLLQLAT